jgi:hypothetical protein
MCSIELVLLGVPDYEENLAAWPQGAVHEVGVGPGLLDRRQEQGLDVVGLNAGWAPIDKERFLNTRAEWLWTLREVFEQGEVDIDSDVTSRRRSSARSSAVWTQEAGSRSRARMACASEGFWLQTGAEALAMSFVERFSLPIDVQQHSGETLMSICWTRHGEG